jgi:hypothetical protein
MTEWASLPERYKDERPRKLLALDGGGFRGVITLEILIKMERMLAEATGKGKDFRLCDFFDYIGGTSTGAIIAAGLARGLSAEELLNFYKDKGSEMFDAAFLLYKVKYLYKSQPLANELQNTFGKDTDLMPESLKCLLLIVTRNLTTDSPWVISSNPRAKYNELTRPDCNLKIPLWKLVRASTAAPVYFAPELIQWDESDATKSFVFEDGGMTPYNNPAFLLYRMATHDAYRLNWKSGEQNLLLISVGTGLSPQVEDEVYAGAKNVGSNLIRFPGALIGGAQIDQDINCRAIGRCVYGADIDRELGDMIPRDETGEKIPLTENLGRAFLYARYNVELTHQGLNCLDLGNIDPAKVSKMDSVNNFNDLSLVGKRLAEEVKLEHFGDFVEQNH